MTHFDEMTCLLYIEGQLDDGHSREIAAHLAECAGCRDLLRALQHESAFLSSALTEENEAIPAHILSEQRRGVPSWVWTLAFAAFAAGVYWFWTNGVGPWIDQLSNAGFGGTDVFSMIVFSGAFWEGWSDMIDAMQIGALILVVILAIGWIRRRLRRPVAVAVVMSMLALAAALPQTASAAEVRRGRAVSVPAGEVIHNDLIVTSPSVRIDGTIEGDLIAFTRDLAVTGHVTGDVIAFAGSARISGTVDGNVRVVTHGTTLEGKIAKNVSAIANNFDLAGTSSVGGGVLLIATQADLDGRIQRDLVGIVATAELEGFIGGDEWIRGGNLTVASTAEIRGQATFEGPQQPTVESGAKLASPMHMEITQERRRNRGSAARLGIRAIFSYAGALVAGLVLLAVFPGFFRATLRETGAIGLPFGVGALALITGGVLAVLAILLLIIGIGAGVAALAAYVPILYLCQIFVGTWLGNKIMGEGPAIPGSVTGAVAGRMAVGLLILHVARLIPVLGALVGIAVALWGTGAVLIGFYRMSRPEGSPVPAAPVPA